MNLVEAKKALKDYWGYERFRYPQAEIVESIIKGQDTLAILPTAAGKSICYQVPALCLPNLSIVISPLIALMEDQVNRLKKIGIKAELINSTLSLDEKNRIYELVYSNSIKLLYLSPESLATNAIKSLLKEINISILAIDEAHCISSWGNDFRPKYKQIISNILEVKKTRNFPIAAFTATATKNTQEDIINSLNLDNPKVIISPILKPNLFVEIVKLDNASWLKLISSSSSKGLVIVYSNTRRRVEEISDALASLGYNSKAYHAGINKNIRKQILNDFINNKINIVVSTNAFGMGVDKSDIRFVFHDRQPESIESYFQEIGRAGRDGLDAKAILLDTWNGIRSRVKMLEDSEVESKFANKFYDYLSESIKDNQVVKINELLNLFADQNLSKISNMLTIFRDAGIIKYEVDRMDKNIIRNIQIDRSIIFLGNKINFRFYKNRYNINSIKLKKMISLIKSDKCMLGSISEYFDQNYYKCKNCYNCINAK